MSSSRSELGQIRHTCALEKQSSDVVARAKKRKRHSGSAPALIGFAIILCLLLSRDLTSRTTHHNSHRSDDFFGSELQSDDTGPFIRSPRRSLLESKTSHQMQRRSLSSIFNMNNCQSNLMMTKQQPQNPIRPAYLATYPGSGSRITRQLIKALTGLRIQNEHEQNPKNDAVATQTKYPHKSGSLVAWDADIHRTIILIRSPMHALISLFDELYASKKHLPVRFHPQQPVFTEDAAPVGEWVSWRDRMFQSQLISYSEFIRYWTKRYGHNKRLIISYEDLVDDRMGSEEATRLTEFLGFPPEISTVPLDDVPCVWQTIIKNGGGIIDDETDEGVTAIDSQLGAKGRRLSTNEIKMTTNSQSEDKGNQMNPSARRMHRQLDSYIIPHPSSIDAAPTARPFTIEQLKAMSTMLLQVSEDLYTHSHQLHQILVRYRDEILELIKSQSEAEGVPMGALVGAPRTRNFHIFHVSPPGTESPVVANWLMGLFEPEAEHTILVTTPGLAVYQHGNEVPIASTIVTQTNEMNLLGLYKIFKPGFDEVFFVLSRSGTDADQQINGKVCGYDNLLCVGYREYENDDGLETIVHHLTEKFQQRFATFFGSMANSPRLDEESAISRLKDMYSARQAIKNEPFEVVDPKFGIHGGLQKEIMDKNNDKYQGGVTKSNIVNDPKLPPRRLFYCGSTGTGANRNISILGIFLANAFFPEIIGAAPTNVEDIREMAIHLTPSSINDATPNDMLVFHMHQYCEVDVLTFPGMQLHINVS
mmetsp:Transcript_1948/g.4209  ORF Transcript_1948/g.4209 Transcript_1948/m.4209 type:complete len:761 (-) Transcript_1948:1020-3302(-)